MDFRQKEITEDIKTLIENKTYASNAKQPPNIKVMSSIIILKLKWDNVWIKSTFNTQVVAFGNYQDRFVKEIDLYAPVVCIKLVKALLYAMVITTRTFKNLDINCAFMDAYTHKD